MNFKKKITVVMSVYKNDKPLFFKEAVDSLLNQTLLPSEIIIVVDGWVSDDIKTIIREFSKNDLVKTIELPENKGLANALNRGISEAKFDLIARMDADDICFNDRFEKQLLFLKNNNLDIVGGQIIEFMKEKGDMATEKRVPLEHENIIKLQKKRNPFTHSTMMFKKKIHSDIGGYSINVFPEDYDFFVRALMKENKSANIEDNVLWFRVGEDQTGMIRRRWGWDYAKKEFLLYKNFFKIGYFNFFEFLVMIFFRIPLRLLPFFVFKFIFLNFARKTK